MNKSTEEIRNDYNVWIVDKYIEELIDIEKMSDEEIKKERMENSKNIVPHFSENKDNLYIPLRIPLIPLFTKSNALTLSEYIILCIIIEYNLQNRFFDEQNKFFKEILGLSDAKIEQALKKLLDCSAISYVDKFGYLTGDIKPINSFNLRKIIKSFDDPSMKFEDKLIKANNGRYGIYCNDKREFAYNNRNDIMIYDYPGLNKILNPDSEMKAKINQEKLEKKNQMIIQQRVDYAMKDFKQFDIDDKTIFSMINESERLSQPKVWANMTYILNFRKCEYSHVFNYMRTNEKYKHLLDSIFGTI